MSHVNRPEVAFSLSSYRIAAQGAGIMVMVLAMRLVPMIDVQAKFLLIGGISAFLVIFCACFAAVFFLRRLCF